MLPFLSEIGEGIFSIISISMAKVFVLSSLGERAMGNGERKKGSKNGDSSSPVHNLLCF
ncbi:hypothetical protein [Gloeothece citriformis]|uniref:hypothetical protein n=1 Tax=Gloeothece citriformis TaxID=2546356 RepID=UPI001389694B|nr:hypothetical protein [Gloeothece citriformis]